MGIYGNILHLWVKIRLKATSAKTMLETRTTSGLQTPAVTISPDVKGDCNKYPEVTPP